MKIRSGIGYDIHGIQPGSGLTIGGVQVSSTLSFKAHSDGDILIHTLIDALLGAAGENDIGELFPDSDDRYKGIASSLILRDVLKILEQKNIEILSIDGVIIAQHPQISPFKEEIKANMVRLLRIEADRFNVKAKTKENFDAVGRGEAIECLCVAMIRQNTP